MITKKIKLQISWHLYYVQDQPYQAIFGACDYYYYFFFLVFNFTFYNILSLKKKCIFLF